MVYGLVYDRNDDYGAGPSLEVRLEALDSLQHPWLEKTMHRYVEL